MRRTDSLILGGGPAGAAAAIMLARAGDKPLLIERNRETGDALCGGFLSWRTLEMLGVLGLEKATLRGHPIDRLRLVAPNSQAEAGLPAPAIGISRQRLDGLLLARAEAAGARIERGIAVRHAGDGLAELGDGATVAADCLFLATGKHDCRGMARPRLSDDPALGLRMRLPPSPALAALVGSAIELHLFRGGYAGLLLQEDGSGNLCMAVRKSRFAEAGSDPQALFAQLARESPRLGQRLALASAGAPIEAIGAVPYGWRARTGVPGIFRLGDQAAVIPSLAGEGIAIAVASGVMAARHRLLEGRGGAIGFQTRLARRTRIPVAIAQGVAAMVATSPGRQVALHLLGTFPALGAAMAQLSRIVP